MPLWFMTTNHKRRINFNCLTEITGFEILIDFNLYTESYIKN